MPANRKFTESEIRQHKWWSEYPTIDLGHSLELEMDHRRRRRSVFSLPETLQLLQPIAEALDYAHANGIVHCAVSPNSIHICNGRTVLVDCAFADNEKGIPGHFVKRFDKELPSKSALYQSPEQIFEGTISGQSDQYSLAVIAYELLSGDRPSRANVVGEFSQQLLREVSFPSGCSELLRAVMRQALSMVPANRFHSCTAFIQALQAVHIASTATVTSPSCKPVHKKPSILNWFLRGMLSIHRLLPVERRLRLGRFYRPSSSAIEALLLDFERVVNLTVPAEAFSEIRR